LSGSQEADDLPPSVGAVHYASGHTHGQQMQPAGFRGRSKTVGDVTGELMSIPDDFAFVEKIANNASLLSSLTSLTSHAVP